MTRRLQSKRETIRRILILATVCWTALVLISLSWNWQWQNHDVRDLATEQARASFYKDIIYRMWNANRGGVYVENQRRQSTQPLSGRSGTTRPDHHQWHPPDSHQPRLYDSAGVRNRGRKIRFARTYHQPQSHYGPKTHRTLGKFRPSNRSTRAPKKPYQ